MSKIQVDAIEQQTSCGSTLTVGGGASKTVVVDATTVTLGRSGGTVALASGASQTGFGRTGTVDWDTTPKTATFTAVSGDGFFCNTSGGAFTVNLPAGSAGAIVSLADYAATWQTNKITVTPNGSDKIGSLNNNAILNTEGQSVTFVFVDSTQGWINTMDSTSNVRGTPPFIQATGGTITQSGNCKIHTFTGPGTFCVSSVSGCAANNATAYMVVAGGGAGGDGGTGEGGGGSGAGGFREGRNNPITPYTASPLAAACSALTISATSFPITVGAGGAPSASGPSNGSGLSGKGSNSVFSTITSAGGGSGISGGPSAARCTSVQNGGSGGGGNGNVQPAKNAGNTPSVSPPQGNPGGDGGASPSYAGGGGGGATAAGQPIDGGGHADGGAGAGTLINPATGEAGPGPSRYYAGGGGNGNQNGSTPGGGEGGIGGGGQGGRNSPKASIDATANTGGGGGGNSCGPGGGTQGCGGSGGSGIVIIRYKFQ